MLLLSLTTRYKAIDRQVHGGRPPERLIDVQARFVHLLSRSLSQPEVYLCLDQIRYQNRHNRKAQGNCLKSLALWLLAALPWSFAFPHLAWLGLVVPLMHLFALLHLGRIQRNLQAIERCLCLLKS